MNKTFLECARDEVGTIYHSGMRQGVKYLILRGPVSVNAYLGIPEDHPLAGQDYNDVNLPVHGWLTFARFGEDGSSWLPEFYWFGWDYAHSGDRCFHDLEYHVFRPDDIEWTPDMIFKEVKEAIPKLVRLMGNIA